MLHVVQKCINEVHFDVSENTKIGVILSYNPTKSYCCEKLWNFYNQLLILPDNAFMYMDYFCEQHFWYLKIYLLKNIQCSSFPNGQKLEELLKKPM